MMMTDEKSGGERWRATRFSRLSAELPGHEGGYVAADPSPLVKPSALAFRRRSAIHRSLSRAALVGARPYRWTDRAPPIAPTGGGLRDRCSNGMKPRSRRSTQNGEPRTGAMPHRNLGAVAKTSAGDVHATHVRTHVCRDRRNHPQISLAVRGVANPARRVCRRLARTHRRAGGWAKAGRYGRLPPSRGIDRAEIVPRALGSQTRRLTPDVANYPMLTSGELERAGIGQRLGFVATQGRGRGNCPARRRADDQRAHRLPIRADGRPRAQQRRPTARRHNPALGHVGLQSLWAMRRYGRAVRHQAAARGARSIQAQTGTPNSRSILTATSSDGFLSLWINSYA